MVGVNVEQSAFQKKKSTIKQLFILRVLIEIVKKTGLPLYIGFFDLEKAFHKVSRLYVSTFCVLSSGGKMSSDFQTFTVIRQGASSSVLLFLVFINDLLDYYLKIHCVEEPIIDMHCLLHADDTAVISTNRELFLLKCNAMIRYFEINKLTPNLSKSACMVINGGKDPQTDLLLSNGLLSYKHKVTNLGSIISEKGNLKYDVNSYIDSKRRNISIKYNNFCRKNYLAPLDIKLKVLNTCTTSALSYGCES